MLIINTGDGKGKTTSAIGVVVRAVGWGKKVAVIQFIKEESWPSGERKILRDLGVDVFVMGKSWVGIMGDKKEFAVHKSAAQEGIKKVLELLNYNSIKTNETIKAIKTRPMYDLIVCDEILGALYGKLFKKKDIETILKSYLLNPNSDLIFTGRNAPKWLIEKADLVTEMKKIKHPFDQGIIAKKGIDY